MNDAQASAPQDGRRLRISLARRIATGLGVYTILLFLFIAGAVVFPKFATAGNLLNILQNITLLGIVCVGAAFVTYSGHYVDLSIPAIMAFTGLAAISAQPMGVLPSLFVGLSAGLLIGAINGYVIGYLRVNPIIWTLAMAFLLDGFLRWFYQGRQIYPDPATPAGAVFLGLSQQKFWDWLPLPTLLMLGFVLVGHGLMKFTKFGSQVQLVGSAYEVARLSGVPTSRVVMHVFVLSAFTTAIGGLLLTSMNCQGTFETGLGYDFNAVTAVVLGGVGLAGGRGSIAGVLGGVLVIGTLLNLMVLLGLGSFAQMVVKGMVFIAVVGTTGWFARRSGRGDE